MEAVHGTLQAFEGHLDGGSFLYQQNDASILEVHRGKP